MVARQLLTRFRPERLDVVLASDPGELRGDAAANYRMFQIVGGSVLRDMPVEARSATLLIDALLGTGVTGPARGRYAELIEEINKGFPAARIVAVDIPSGLPHSPSVRAHHTVTFVAPKLDQVLWPHYEHCGEMIVGDIGAPRHLLEMAQLSLADPRDFCDLFAAAERQLEQGAVWSRAGGGRRTWKIRRGCNGRNCGAARGSGTGDGRFG